MPMLQYAEVDEKAWRPLEIQERLDAYYSFREARHEELKPLPKKADPFAHRELSFIPAESLGTLPETAHMTIAARRAFFNPKSREEIIADLEKRRLEAEARQAAREEAEPSGFPGGGEPVPDGGLVDWEAASRRVVGDGTS